MLCDALTPSPSFSVLIGPGLFCGHFFLDLFNLCLRQKNSVCFSLFCFFLSVEMMEAENEVMICRIKSFRIFLCSVHHLPVDSGQVPESELFPGQMGRAGLAS